MMYRAECNMLRRLGVNVYVVVSTAGDHTLQLDARRSICVLLLKGAVFACRISSLSEGI